MPDKEWGLKKISEIAISLRIGSYLRLEVQFNYAGLSDAGRRRPRIGVMERIHEWGWCELAIREPRRLMSAPMCQLGVSRGVLARCAVRTKSASGGKRNQRAARAAVSSA